MKLLTEATQQELGMKLAEVKHQASCGGSVNILTSEDRAKLKFHGSMTWTAFYDQFKAEVGHNWTAQKKAMHLTCFPTEAGH
jgi:hypothetical protein